MKGWIKVHSEERETFLRADSINVVYAGSDEIDTYVVAGNTHVPVEETAGEVMEMIEEEEEKEKPWYEKAKEECKKRDYLCLGCPFTELCLLPRMWKSNPIPEEYR